jgi:hypothetical protein
LAREETKRAEEEERERLELQELQEQCKEIKVLEKLVNRRKREVSSCLDSLPPVRRARIIVEWRNSPPKAECRTSSFRVVIFQSLRNKDVLPQDSFFINA